MNDWDNLRVALAVFRYGTLAAAARMLAIDETTVGRRLKDLEARLGTRLFDRTAKGLVPTDAADAIRVAAETAEAAILGMRSEVAGRDDTPAGFVRVTATETLASHFLIPALGAFRERYPEIRIELYSGYVALDVARGEADIAIRALPPVGNHLVSRRLGAVALGVYASPAYLARRPVGAFAQGLAGHDLIDYSPLMHPRPPGAPFLGADLRGARLSFTTNSPFGMTIAAEAGLGLAMLPCYVAARRPGLVRVWPERVETYDVLAVLRQEARRAGRIRAAVDHFVAHFRRSRELLEGR